MRYRLKLSTESPVLVGGQFESGFADVATARHDPGADKAGGDRQVGYPYLPATAIKGAMRIEFERLMRSLDSGEIGKPVCDAPDPQTMCASDDLCIVCSLFGSPERWPGKLRFTDGVTTVGDFIDDAYVERTSVSISRVLKRAEDKKLFNFEAAPSKLAFEACIDTLGELTPNERTWFEAALRWWQNQGLSVGGGRSRGLGKLAVEYQPAEADVSEFPRIGSLSGRTTYRVQFRAADRGGRPGTDMPEPLRVGDVNKRRFFLGNLGFIPGSAARGAIGWALAHSSAPPVTIESLLSRNPIQISHLYPARPDDIMPASALECRNHKQLANAKWDSLLLHFVLDLALTAGNDAAVKRLMTTLSKCPLLDGGRPCEGKLKPSEFLPAGERRLQIKLAMDRALGRAEDGMFYIYDCLAPEGAFHGYARVPDGAEDLLNRLGATIQIGGGRSKGFGAGSLEFARAETYGEPESIQARTEELNERAAGLCDALGISRQGGTLATVTCLTDLCPPPGMSFDSLLEGALPGSRVVAAAASWCWMGGWSQQANHTKPLVQVLRRGSAALLCLPGDAGSKASADNLVVVERDGLGVMREYGFGWLSVCHPFHSKPLRLAEEDPDA